MIRRYISQITILALCLACSSFSLNAQDQRMSEEAIQEEDRFVRATLLVHTGKRKEGIRVLDTLRREMQSPPASVFVTLAQWNYEEKEIAAAENYLNQALQIDPANVWILKFGFQFYKETGRPAEASRMADQLIATQPQQVKWHDLKISWLESQEKYSEVLDALNAKELVQGFSTSHTLKKVQFLQKLGRTDEALREIDQLNKAYPDEVKYLQLAAAVLHEAGRVSESKPYLEKILQLDPNDADAKTGLTLIAGTAYSDAEILMELRPLMAEKQGNVQKKIETLLPFLLEHISVPDSATGLSLEQLGQILTATHPNSAACHAVYGDILKSNGKTERAIASYQAALAISQRPFTVWEQLMFCLELQDDMVNLKQTATAALDVFPNQALPYIFLALAQIRIGEGAKAISQLEEAELIAAGNKDLESRIQSTWGLLDFYQKNLTQAESRIEKALESSSGKNGLAWEVKGDILFASGQLSEAQACWQRAAQLNGNRPSLLKKINSNK